MRIFFTLLLLMTSPVLAQDAASLDKMQQQLTDCLAYFQLVKQCAPKDASETVLKNVETVIDRFIKMSFVAGKAAGMTQEAMLSRLTGSIQDQMKQTSGNCTSMDTLRNSQENKCVQLGEKAPATLENLRNQ